MKNDFFIFVELYFQRLLLPVTQTCILLFFLSLTVNYLGCACQNNTVTSLLLLFVFSL